MEPILEDHLLSCKLKEDNGSSSHQMDKIRDEKLQYADLDSVGDKQLQCGLNTDLDSFRLRHESFLDMLLWLQSVAKGLYTEKSVSKSPRESWRQILNARKVLSLSHHEEAPWRKRKLDQLLQESARSPSNLPSKKPTERSTTKRGNHSIASSSFTCLTNYAYYDESLDPQGSLEFGVPYGQADSLERLSPSDTTVFDSDESISGSFFAKRHIQASQQRPIKLLKSGNNDPRKQVRIRPYPNNDYVKKSWKHETPQTPAKKLFEFIGDYLPRMAIPVGPRFQAEIPNVIVIGSTDSDKWLGTRVWPTEGINSDTLSKGTIGKGRPNSCSCNSPRSIQCIRLHVADKKFRLQFDLSSAYFSWKFHEMGEEVSRWWTPVEEKSFRVIVKTNPVSKNMSFWEPALKCFPSKPRPSVVSYYFNVFVLRRMSRQTRLLGSQVDSDDDEIDDEGVAQSKDVKQRYLTGIR